MALAPVSARNRVSPLSVAMLDQTSGAYDEVELCTDPNCTVCQASGTRRRHHHHHHKHHHKRQHHKKDKTSFWNNFLPRGESSTSLVSVHSIQLDEARPRYREEVRERALVPVNQSERQVGTTTTTTRTNRVAEDEVLRDAWVAISPTSENGHLSRLHLDQQSYVR